MIVKNAGVATVNTPMSDPFFTYHFSITAPDGKDAELITLGKEASTDQLRGFKKFFEEGQQRSVHHRNFQSS